MEELDEFGIPIKKATSQHSVDEFGIPIKKKVDTTSTTANQKSVSDANTGSLGGVNPAFKSSIPSPIPYFNSMQSVGKKPIVTPKVKYKEGTVAWNHQKMIENNPDYVSNYDKFKQVKNVSDAKKAEIAQENEDEFNGVGIWNNVKSFGKDVVNSTLQGLSTLADIHPDDKKEIKVETDPFADQKAKAKKEFQEKVLLAKKNKETIPVFTSQDINQRAKEIKLQERIESQSETQIKDFLKEDNDTGGLQKNRFQSFEIGNYATIQEKDKVLLEQQNIERNVIKGLEGELKGLEQKLTENGLSPENLKLYKEKNNSLTVIKSEYDKADSDFKNSDQYKNYIKKSEELKPIDVKYKSINAELEKAKLDIEDARKNKDSKKESELITIYNQKVKESNAVREQYNAIYDGIKDNSFIENYNKNIEGIRSRYNNAYKEVSALSKTANKSNQVSVEYNEKYKKYQEVITESIATHNKYVSNRKNLGSATENLDIFKRDYGSLKSFIGNVDAVIGDLSAGVVGAVDYALEAKKNITGSQSANELYAQKIAQGVATDLKSDSDKVRSEIMKPIAVDNINNLSDLGDWFFQTAVAQQVPIFGLIATGGFGVGAIGVSSGGQRLNDMRGEIERGEKQYTDKELMLHPVGFAIAETASAAVDLMILKNAARVIASATRPERQMIASGFANRAMKIGGVTTRGGIYEGVDEGLTKGAENLIEGKPFTEGMKDPIAAGAVMGMLIPFGANLFAEATKPFSTDTKIQEASAEILNLQNELDKPNLSTETRDLIKDNLAKTQAKVEVLMKKQIGKIESLSKEQFQEIIKNEKTQANIKKQAESIQLDENISAETKRQLLSNLKAEFKAQNERRMDLLARGASVQMERLDPAESIRLKDLAQKRLMKEQNPDGTKNITLEDEEISRMAIQIRNAEIKEQNLINARDKELSERGKSNQTENQLPPIPENYNIVDTPVVNNNSSLEQKSKEASEKIKRKDLFSEGGSFSNQLGESGVDSVPTNHTEINGIEFVEFSNPNTGIVDVVMSGTSDTDFVGYYRIYENGKPTDKWSSKFENQSRNKENFKTMIGGVQSMLPEGHKYTETTSISTDGLRVWEQQLSRGYELQTDENGNLVTNEVAINGDAIVNELGIDVNQGNFDNISVTNNQQFQSVKKALLPYLQKFGLNESNIRNVNGTVEIDLPVLRKTKKQNEQNTTTTTPEAQPQDDLKSGTYEYNGKIYKYDGKSLTDETGSNLYPLSFEEDSLLNQIKNKGKLINEVPQQAEAEKVSTEPISANTEPTSVLSENKEVSPVEDVVATSVEEIKKLIPNTKIINKNGEPIKVYHGTRSADDFTSFEKGDIGFHFGRKETAKQRGENVLEVYLDIKNPIDIKDNGAFEGQELVDSLYDAKVLNEEEYDYFSNEMSELPEDEIYGYNTDVNKQLRDKIKEKGYDGFTYTNMYEGSAGKSFIALDNSQIIFSESLKNEATPETNTPTNGNVQLGASNVGESGNAKPKSNSKSSIPSSVDGGEGKSSIEHAKEQINNGILEWNGDINSPRIDLDMSWADIRKGQADLAKGKENTVPAKRLIEAINNAKELGGYNYKYGTGGENMRAKEFVSFEDLQKTKNEYQLNDAELKEVKDNELENAKKYDEYFNKLSKEEQIDILDDYENRGNTNTGEVSENVNGGEIKENISNEQTKSERGQESAGIEKVISSDVRRERSSEEKAKDLGIEHNKYLDFKDLVEKTPSSGVFKDYLSGKTIEETFGKATNDQSYETTVLLDASQHGDLVLQHAKELFGENYIPKTLEFLKDAKMDNFEKAVVYASMENLMDTKVKESPDNKSLKTLQELVYKDSQANLSNSSKGLNAGRLRRIHNAVKNGYDIELLTDKVYNDKQLEAKDALKDIDVSGENLNKESDNITDVKLEKLIAEGVQAEIKKLAKNLPTSRRIKADKAIKALEEIQKGLRNKTYDATIGVPITIIDSGITVIKNALDIGTNLIDAIEMGINHIREKHGKDWEENTFREDFIKGFKDRNIDVKETKISDIVKQALIDAGFSRDIKIKGEVKKVLDWVKLTARMNNVDALKENVETKLKEQGYTDKQISDISTELEAEYKRLTQNVTDKAIADLERRNLIKPSPNRKSDSKRLADLYNQGLFGDNIKKYENVINSILGFSDIDFKKYSEIQKKAKTMSDIYNQKVDGKPITDLSISSLSSILNKEISDLLTLASLKESSKDGFKGKFFAFTEIGKQFSSLGLKSLLGTIRGLAENKFSGVYAGILQKLVTRGEMTPELAKQFNKNADMVLKDITEQGGTDYGNTQTTLVSGSLLEDMASNKIKSKLGHKVLTAITIRRFLNGYDSYIKTKLTETAFVKNSIKILEKKGWSKEDALKHISESLTGDSFTKALEVAKNIIDNVNSQQEGKQIKDNSETIHRFAMDIVKQNLMKGDVMTMQEIQKSYNASYKGAGSDIGHEANNYLAEQVGFYSQKLNKDLNEAIKDKNWTLASLKNVEIMINKVIISPFAGGGSNWIVIGAEKGVPIIGYIPTMANALKRTELDLESVSGQKNIEKSLYYDYKTKSSFVRNIASTGMALTAYTTMFGMSGFGLKDDDEENNAKKLNDWMNENDWVKPYFNKLSPFAFVMATAINDGNYGKLLAQTFGMSGEVFNNSLKVIKSLDNDKEGSTSGAIGKLLGQFSNSPIAWKYILDAFNVWRGLKGLSQIKTDYQLEGFLDGFYQGGFTEATGLVIDNLKGIEQSKKSSSSSSGVKISKKKFKKYKKF